MMLNELVKIAEAQSVLDENAEDEGMCEKCYKVGFAVVEVGCYALKL